MKPSIQKILTIYRAIMLPAAEGQQYGENLGDEFVRKNAAESAARIVGTRVDFGDLTDAEAELLGFPLWSKETGIRLVPLWLYAHMAPGQTLHCIDGSSIVVADNYTTRDGGNYIDNDHRGGAIAYGFIPHAA